MRSETPDARRLFKTIAERSADAIFAKARQPPSPLAFPEPPAMPSRESADA